MTILECLKGINAYPVPQRTLSEIALRRGLSLDAEATQEELTGTAYMLAQADLLLWLSNAPDVSQGGQSYSFSEDQRTQLRRRATALAEQYAEASRTANKTYGYKGSRL